MEFYTQQNIEIPVSKTDLTEFQFFESSSHIRASTAPSRPLSQLQQFKLSKQFSQLEQSVICSNQLLHKSFDKLDLETPEGQNTCQKYLNIIEGLCKVYEVNTLSRQYRAFFSQAYKVLYKDGQLSYLTEILDSAQQGFPFLWVNGQKYPFTQEVLDHGSRLMIQFYKLEHCLREFYGKIMQDVIDISVEQVMTEIKENLLEFDTGWSTFENRYVVELMGIQLEARRLVTKAIEAEKCLTSVEIREKMKGKILINCEDYLQARGQLCEIISQINHVANEMGKGLDNLQHSILCQTQSILRRITKDQSKAVRILGQKIRSSFSNIRALLKKYDKNIEMVDPQLKNNKDLVETLVQYERSWEKGANYFCDSQRRKHLLHFSGSLETILEKYVQFQEMIEWVSPSLFLVIPYILILKSLDKDDRNLCKYFLPSLNQIETKTFRVYFELQKQFDQWKKHGLQHYSYYNILEKMLIEVELSEIETKKVAQHRQLIDKIIARIKSIGMQLHANSTEWNAFMEICLAGSVKDSALSE